MKDLPFSLKFTLAYFALDTVKNLAIFLPSTFYAWNSGFLQANPRLFLATNMIYLIMVGFNSLVIAQIALRISLVQLWVSVYCLITVFYLISYFTILVPESWVYLGLVGRVLQVATIVISLVILYAVNHPKSGEALVN